MSGIRAEVRSKIVHLLKKCINIICKFNYVLCIINYYVTKIGLSLYIYIYYMNRTLVHQIKIKKCTVEQLHLLRLQLQLIRTK